jgi:transposase
MTAMTRSREEMMHLCLMFYQKGLPCRAIACELGVSYYTVRRLLAAYTRASRPPAHPPLDSDPTTSSPDEDTTT